MAEKPGVAVLRGAVEHYAGCRLPARECPVCLRVMGAPLLARRVELRRTRGGTEGQAVTGYVHPLEAAGFTNGLGGWGTGPEDRSREYMHRRAAAWFDSYAPRTPASRAMGWHAAREAFAAWCETAAVADPRAMYPELLRRWRKTVEVG